MALFNNIKIRKRITKHSGDTPKNILGGKKTMANELRTITKPITQPATLMEGALKGASLFIGLGLTRGLSGMVSRSFPAGLGPISARTITGAVSSMLLFWGSKRLKQPMLKDVMTFGFYGASAFTVGSLIFDVVDAMNLRLPQGMTNLLAFGTGQPIAQEEASATKT